MCSHKIARQHLQEKMDEDEFVAGLMLRLQSKDEEKECKVVGGSRPQKRPNVERTRVKMNRKMMKDYFVDIPVYGFVVVPKLEYTSVVL